MDISESESENSSYIKECITGPIRTRLEDIYTDEKFQKIINFSDVRKGELNVNIIHYDKNIKNGNNMKYYRYLSIDTVGGYFPFDDFDMLKIFISKLSLIPFTSSYIFIISGTDIEKILVEFHKYDFLIEFIIFIRNNNNYMNNKYNKIKLITSKFNKIRKYLKTKKFSKEDLDMDNLSFMTPLITYYEYKKAIFPIHRILAYFFKYQNFRFTEEYFLRANEFIKKSSFDIKTKENIIKIMGNLNHQSFSNFNFSKECIKAYTGEDLYYVFNKALRNFEKFYVEMCYFIGPFYYGLFYYALKKEEKALNKKAILYRDITLNKLDLYSYKFRENDIICFQFFTSTTLKEDLNFVPTENAKKMNYNGEKQDDDYVKLIISYNPEGKCVPQGIDVSEDSKYPGEKEILLFPFTFLKIDKVEMHSGKIDDKHYIYLTIINRESPLEYCLNNNWAFKLVENGTKLVVDKDNDLKCDTNESYYEMYSNEIKEIIQGKLNNINTKVNNNTNYQQNYTKRDNDKGCCILF